MATLCFEPNSLTADQVTRQLRGTRYPFSYTSCYCEENVHLLVPALVRLGLAPSLNGLFAVFVSNTIKQVPLWKQRAGLARDYRRHRSRCSRGGHREQQRSGGEDGGGGGGSGGSSRTRSSDSEDEGEGEDGGRGVSSGSGDEGSDGDEGLVVWDYHVVLLQAPSGPSGSLDPGPAGPGSPGREPTGPGPAPARRQLGAAASGVWAGEAGGPASAQLTSAGAATDAATTAPLTIAAQTAGCSTTATASAETPGGCLHFGRGAGDDGGTTTAGGGDDADGSGVTGGGGGGGGATAAAAAGGSPGGALVWDLDTLLPFPCSLKSYARRALKSHQQLLQPHRRFFRIVPAASYLRHFASDRSHMRRPDGGWSAPPPPYPPLVAADGTTNNIQCYWDMATPATTAAADVDAARALPPASARNGALLEQIMATAGPYGVVLDEQSFLRAFGVGDTAESE